MGACMESIQVSLSKQLQAKALRGIFCLYQFGTGFIDGIGDVPQIKLTRKLALSMNGVDVSRLKVGDVIDLPHEQALMMVECGWAEFVIEPMMPLSLPRKSQSDLAS
jgi:hypothetical protein